MFLYIKCNKSSHILDCSHSVERFLSVDHLGARLRYAVDMFKGPVWNAITSTVDCEGKYESHSLRVYRKGTGRSVIMRVKAVPCAEGYLITMERIQKERKPGMMTSLEARALKNARNVNHDGNIES